MECKTNREFVIFYFVGRYFDFPRRKIRKNLTVLCQQVSGQKLNYFTPKVMAAATILFLSHKINTFPVFYYEPLFLLISFDNLLLLIKIVNACFHIRFRY